MPAIAFAVVLFLLPLPAISGTEEFYWLNVNESPYRGSAEAAIKAMAAHGLPKEAVNDLNRRIARKGFTPGIIAKGEKCRLMIAGAGVVKKNVNMAWKNFAALETEDYEAVGSDLVVRRVPVCNNWLLCARAGPRVAAPAAAPATAPAPPPPQLALPVISPPVSAGPLEPYHTIEIRLWDSASLPPDLLRKIREGQSQSRDFGSFLRQAAARGEVRYYPGRHSFVVEFMDADFAGAAGRNLYINGEVHHFLDSFGPSSRINVEVGAREEGKGFLTLPASLATDTTAMFIRTPWLKPQLVYPPSGTLKTCAPATAATCGRTIRQGEIGELKKLFGHLSSISYHHVIK